MMSKALGVGKGISEKQVNGRELRVILVIDKILKNVEVICTWPLAILMNNRCSHRGKD